MGAFNWSMLDDLASRGSQAKKAARMADLHEKRLETLSQFFTPAWVVEAAWSFISTAFVPGERYRLLDNSIGAASMFRFADPAVHTLHGIDVDQELIAKVTEQLDHAGFECDIQAIPMEDAILGKYSAALINPPFSITLSSPYLTAYEGVTSYGKHGPNTSALSHEYALAQALEHASIVAAVLPRTTTERLLDGPLQHTRMGKRLAGVYALPTSAFAEQNVKSVATDLLIFSDDVRALKDQGTLSEGQPYPVLPEPLVCLTERSCERKPIRAVGVEESEPVVTLPVTQDNRVILNRAGRWVTLRFFDAATEVKVKNALWKSRVRSSNLHRYPSRTRYAGQYKLSLDAMMLQEDPFAALEHVSTIIKEAGGQPHVTLQLRHGLKALLKEHAQMSIPYGRTVYRKGTPSFSATARRMGMINRKEARSVVAMGEQVTALRNDNGFQVTTQRGTFSLPHDSFMALFEIEEEAAGAGYWEEVHPAIRQTYPQQIGNLERQARQLGLHEWLTWDFQLEDLCELAFRPAGGICGWQMALGKTRLILALALLQSGHSLIVVKSRLVDELMRELAALNVPDHLYQHIQGVGALEQLRSINIVSYETLRRPLHQRWPKLTLAKRMKNRFANIYCDEGGCLSNMHTNQTRAVWALGGRKHYIFDGTPIANYPRDILPMAEWCVGAERSYQPYSASSGGGYLYPEVFNTATMQPTGRAAFQEHFVTMVWATNEFTDTGLGAKREVPKIKSGGLPRFRQWLSALVKRRVQQEPDVSKHVRFPVPTLHEPTHVPWDMEHLVTYTRTVEEFADWYRSYCDTQNEQGNSLNLTIILQRLEASFKAANAPHTLSGVVPAYTPVTSKQRACVDLIVKEVKAGRRPIVFARNPSTLKRLHGLLAKLGISALVFTGEETIKKRTARLNAEIREGNTQVMLASLGVTQDGLNLPELNTFIFYNRSFKSREEFQAIYRLLRAAQKSDVHGFFLHLEGSLDDYMGQMVEWKALASESGLDYGEGVADEEEFVHFDAILQRFIDSIPELKERIKALRRPATYNAAA